MPWRARAAAGKRCGRSAPRGPRTRRATAPAGRWRSRPRRRGPATSKAISTNLPKRDELSLRTVLALPKASSRGLDSRTCSSMGAAARGRRRRSGGVRGAPRRRSGGVFAPAAPRFPLGPAPASAGGAARRQVLHDQLGRLGLARARLPDDQDRLRRRSSIIIAVKAGLGDRVAVRGQLPERRAAVGRHGAGAVEVAQPLVRVGGDEDGARVGVDHVELVADAEGVEDSNGWCVGGWVGVFGGG